MIALPTGSALLNGWKYIRVLVTMIRPGLHTRGVMRSPGEGGREREREREIEREREYKDNENLVPHKQNDRRR